MARCALCAAGRRGRSILLDFDTALVFPLNKYCGSVNRSFDSSSAAHAVVTCDVVETEKCCSGQPTQQLPAGSRDPLERDPGRPDGPLDGAARQYWWRGRAGCRPGAIQAGVENVDSAAVKNRLKKSASIAPV